MDLTKAHSLPGKMMSKKAEDYRAKAKDAEDKASEAPLEFRDQFLNIARQWHRLADDAETIEDITRRLKI